MNPMIELELRGECTETFDALKARLDARAEGRYERRVMAMFFGEVAGKQVDIRCRVTNGAGEVVAKVGDFHAHDRKEVSVSVRVDQVAEFAQLFSVVGFSNAKVGVRESFEYSIDGVEVSLVRGMSGLGYVEFERLVAPEDVDVVRPELEALATGLEVTLWKTGDEYYAFCQRLTDDEDWKFTGSSKDVIRLQQALNQ